MNRRVVIALIVGVLLVGAATLSAQVPALYVRLTIPFEFRAGNTVLPAGQYRIEYVRPAYGLMRIQNLHSDAIAAVFGVPVQKESGTSAKLVFHRYGDTYFLRQVWIPGHYGNEFAPTKAERELVNLLKQRPRTVEVAQAADLKK
jgi:hypothetical protein